MANILDRNNQHLLLEKVDNTNNSFIANINKLAAKLNIIIEAVGLFDENVIPILEEIAELDLDAAIKDLEKGSYLGNRKIDINLLYNMTDIDADTDEAIATEAWTDPTKTVMYSGATALFKDGVSIYIPFMFDENPVNISTHADLLLQLNANQEFLEKLDNTLIASFAHPVVGEILRIYDVDGVASNLDRLTLHAVTGSFKEANTAYYWTKSTSALQTLAMRVGDINMIGSNIESFITLANNVIQLVNLQERIPELVDTYTDGVANGDATLYNNLAKLIALHTNLSALQVLHTNINKIISVKDNINLIQEVSDNIVPNLTAILSSYTHAIEAKNAANTAKEYRDSASTSAATALAKANEIKRVTVGSTTTAVAGSNASVIYDTNSGKFHFVIPQGIKGDKGDAFTINARGTTDQRSLYDNEVAGFSFFDLNTSQLYLKLTKDSGNWSDGIQFGKGDPGEDGAAGVGVSSITFTSTTDPSGNPGQPSAVDTYSINYTDGSTTTFTVANGNSFNLPDSTSKVYVSKQGNDLNNGLSIENPKATIASAITAASVLLTNNPRAVVEVMDASRYQEDITIPQNIMVRGSDAMLEGTVVLNNNSYFDMYAHYARVSDSVMVNKVGNSHSYYKVVVQDAGGTLGSLTGCTNLRNDATGGILFAQIELQKVTHVGVKEETATGVGHIHVRIKDMYLTADNAIGIYGVGTASDIVGTVDHILMSGSLSNTRGIIFDSTNGSLNITSNKIAAAIAYSVTKGNVKISCPDITGTTSGNASVVLTTGNLSDSLNLDSSTTPASSKAVKTVNDKLSTTQTELQEAIDNINPATTTTRGVVRIGTLNDVGNPSSITDGPAVLAVGSEALNALVPTFLIGSIISTYAADGYVPNGCVPPDGAEYTQSQFPTFYTGYLTAGRVVTCTYTEFAAQVALTGNCAKFALDTVNKKFKVPLLKDGDSITQAVSASEIGKSVEAGLPEIYGKLQAATDSTSTFLGDAPLVSESGALKATWSGAKGGVSEAGGNAWGFNALEIKASLSNPIYGNSNTVTDEQVRLRHFVVLASAQNNSSMFDWSNYMAALAGKANIDFDNIPLTGKANAGKAVAYALDYDNPVSFPISDTGVYAPVGGLVVGWFWLDSAAPTDTGTVTVGNTQVAAVEKNKAVGNLSYFIDPGVMVKKTVGVHVEEVVIVPWKVV